MRKQIIPDDILSKIVEVNQAKKVHNETIVFDYETALHLRRVINNYPAPKFTWEQWAKMLQLTPDSANVIEAIAENKAFPTLPEHQDYVNGITDTI